VPGSVPRKRLAAATRSTVGRAAPLASPSAPSS
jgi:hypothetical protein